VIGRDLTIPPTLLACADQPLLTNLDLSVLCVVRCHLDRYSRIIRRRFADLPQIEGPTGRFMLQQMAAVAELEAGMISKRTKDALAAAKARGRKLGGNRGVVISRKARMAGCAARTAIAQARAADLAPTMAELRAGGATTLAEFAAGLNERSIPTARKAGEWSPIQVSRVLARINRAKH
jgi:hypothetical protein